MTQAKLQAHRLSNRLWFYGRAQWHGAGLAWVRLLESMPKPSSQFAPDGLAGGGLSGLAASRLGSFGLGASALGVST